MSFFPALPDDRHDAAMQLGRSGDGGVDGVINEDRHGLDRVYVQAKRYAEGNVIRRPAVQNFVGSLVGMGATVFSLKTPRARGIRDPVNCDPCFPPYIPVRFQAEVITELEQLLIAIDQGGKPK
jgi:hypothetical protein